MRHYKPLNSQSFAVDEYSIVPLRDEDKYDIMNWRNEQIYHLRQKSPLTKKSQEQYFATTISELFQQEHPDQLLFSFLRQKKCIGYGGLVHINWFDRNAEISFIMNTHLEKNEFHKNWSIYLSLLEKMAFEELNFNKIYVYAFDLRPHLYEVLESEHYFLDARLKNHVRYENEYIDVVIFSKLQQNDEDRITC